MYLPPYPQYPELTADGILLREVLPEDIAALMPISFYDGKPAETLAKAAQMQARIDADYAQGNSIHWCIVDSLTHEITGTLGYYRGFANKAGELGLVLLPQYYGKGYMTRAMKLAVDFGLNTIGLNRIVAITNKSNNKTRQLLDRLNFTFVKKLEDDEVEFEFKKQPV